MNNQLSNSTSTNHFVCTHIAKRDATDCIDFIQYYTGKGKEYYLLCPKCQTIKEIKKENLSAISKSHFLEIEENGDHYDGIILGKPEVLKKPTPIRFLQKTLNLKIPKNENIISICSGNHNIWYILTQSGSLFLLNTKIETLNKISNVPDSKVDLNKQIVLKVSDDGKYCAMANMRGQFGVVWNMQTSNVILNLDRNDYHINSCNFSLSMFTYKNENYLIHPTDWNRLDLFNLDKCKSVSERTTSSIKVHGKNYLDYFHCELTLSPKQQYIYDGGWIWHPIGIGRMWNIENWINNKWESESGKSVKEITYRYYCWDAPVCWLDEHTIAIWGHGIDYMLDAVEIYDIISGKLLRWFAGPKKGQLFNISNYLASVSSDGTSIWDIATGEILHEDNLMKSTIWDKVTGEILHEENLIKPAYFHFKDEVFLSINDDGNVTISELKAK